MAHIECFYGSLLTVNLVDTLDMKQYRSRNRSIQGIQRKQKTEKFTFATATPERKALMTVVLKILTD